jgi:hypothetical protein
MTFQDCREIHFAQRSGKRAIMDYRPGAGNNIDDL